MDLGLFKLLPSHVNRQKIKDQKRLMLLTSVEKLKDRIRALKQEKPSLKLRRQIRQQCGRLRLTQLQLFRITMSSDTQAASDEPTANKITS